MPTQLQLVILVQDTVAVVIRIRGVLHAITIVILVTVQNTVSIIVLVI